MRAYVRDGLDVYCFQPAKLRDVFASALGTAIALGIGEEDVPEGLQKDRLIKGVMSEREHTAVSIELRKKPSSKSERSTVKPFHMKVGQKPRPGLPPAWRRLWRTL